MCAIQNEDQIEKKMTNLREYGKKNLEKREEKKGTILRCEEVEVDLKKKNIFLFSLESGWIKSFVRGGN